MPRMATILVKKTIRTVSRNCQHYKLCHIHVERQLKTARRNCIHLGQFKDQWRHSFANRRKQMF